MSRGKRIAAIIYLVVLFCALVFVVYEVFQVRKIIVNGCQTIKQEDVVALSGLEYGKSIFLVNTEKAMGALARNSYIKPVSVSIVYPYSIEIVIEERVPAAYTEKDGMRLIMDKEGYLLKVDAVTGEAEVPLVTGLQIDVFETGKRVGTDTFKLDVLCSVLEQVQKNAMNITTIDLTYAASIVLKTSQGLAIEIGDDTLLEQKFALAVSSMKELEQRGKTGGKLDVATATAAYYREN